MKKQMCYFGHKYLNTELGILLFSKGLLSYVHS